MKEMLRPGYGQVLAQARKDKELSLADVATKLKLTVRQVEALEAEDGGQLPGDVFLRGFVRNYARLMELDPDAVIAPMDAEAAVAETITAHSEGVTISSRGLKRWLLIPVIILAVFVVFVAVLYQWLRQGEDTLLTQGANNSGHAEVTQTLSLPNSVSGAEPAQGAQGVQGSQESALSTPAMPGATTMETVQGGANAPASPAAEGGQGNVSANPVPAAPSSEPTPPAEPVSQSEALHKEAAANKKAHTLRFLATQDAWVQVVDGQGKRFSRLIRAGVSDSISGTAPFKLVVGEAAQVRLTYDGYAIDLAPFIGQKVARLTLE